LPEKDICRTGKIPEFPLVTGNVAQTRRVRRQECNANCAPERATGSASLIRNVIRAASRFSQFLRNPFEHLPRIRKTPLYIHFVRDDAVRTKRSSGMLQKIIRVSSLAFVLAMGASISAHASELNVSANEEDLAAPHGSFTSDMAAPADFTAARLERRERFAMRFGDEARRMRQEWDDGSDR